MPRVLIDTSCIVPAVSRWHEHHRAAAAEINRRRGQREHMLVAAHSLMESYSVLTRLPPPRRLPPATALRLLEESFGAAEATALDAEAYRHLLRVAPHRGISGGRIYDAIIYACARAAGADTLLTFNEQHFLAVADGQIEIVVPQEQKDPASDSLPAPE